MKAHARVNSVLAGLFGLIALAASLPALAGDRGEWPVSSWTPPPPYTIFGPPPPTYAPQPPASVYSPTPNYLQPPVVVAPGPVIGFDGSLRRFDDRHHHQHDWRADRDRR